MVQQSAAAAKRVSQRRSGGEGPGGQRAAAPVVTGVGTATGSTVPINLFTTEHRTKPAPVSAPVQNRLDITAQNIRTVTIDPQQAQVSCDAELNVTTDGPVTVRLIGCPTRSFG